MTDLLADVLEAHGGMGRWNQRTMLRATVISGGDLFVIKGVPRDPAPREMTIWLHRERALVAPFGDAEGRPYPGLVMVSIDISNVVFS